MAWDEENRADWTADELADAVAQTEWDIVMTAAHEQGVTVTFRKDYPAKQPGTATEETREVSGTDQADALRKFLAELDREESEGYDA